MPGANQIIGSLRMGRRGARRAGLPKARARRGSAGPGAAAPLDSYTAAFGSGSDPAFGMSLPEKPTVSQTHDHNAMANDQVRRSGQNGHDQAGAYDRQL